MTERKTPTDEYKKVLMAQALGSGQKRHRSTEEIRAALGWRNVPLTIGLLAALILGVVFIASAVRGYQSDVAAQIDRAIVMHNKASDAHEFIRDEIKRQAQQTRELVRELRKDIENKTTRRPRR